MARKKDETLSLRRKASGKRLAEMIKARRLKPKDFLDQMIETYGNHDIEDPYLQGLNDLSTLSNILNGRRTLTNDIAAKAAELLDVDVNYFLGTIDHFSETSYDDYLAFKDGPGKMKDTWKKYNSLLSHAGYKIISATFVDNDLHDFVVIGNGCKAYVEAEDMKNFYEDVRKFIKKRIDPTIEMSNKEK